MNITEAQNTFINKSNLDKLFFSKYRFTLESNKKIEFVENLDSIIRGTFGTSLKNIVCINEEKNCTPCNYRKNCAFIYIILNDDKKHIPKPYILDFEKFDGKILNFSITLIGNANKYYKQIFYSIRELCILGLGKDREEFSLVKVEALTKKLDFKMVYDKNNNISIAEKITINDINITHSNKFLLEIIKPLRIDQDKELIKDLNSQVFFKTLLRRLSSLMYFYCDTNLDIDFENFFEIASSITMIKKELFFKSKKRYSARQDKEIPLYGLKGSIEIEGNLEIFYLFLILGSYLHVGKGVSFGMGKYQLLNIS